MGGAAGADRLIRWFLTDLPTSFLSLFSSLGAGRRELSHFHAFRRCIQMTFMLHSSGEKPGSCTGVVQAERANKS